MTYPRVENQPHMLQTVLSLVEAEQGVSIVPACARNLRSNGVRTVCNQMMCGSSLSPHGKQRPVRCPSRLFGSPPWTRFELCGVKTILVEPDHLIDRMRDSACEDRSIQTGPPDWMRLEL